VLARAPGCRILSKQKETADEEPPSSGFRRRRERGEETGAEPPRAAKGDSFKDELERERERMAALQRATPS